MDAEVLEKEKKRRKEKFRFSFFLNEGIEVGTRKV